MSKCRELLQKHEGLKLFPYKCTAGKLTIGYGRNIEDTGISEDEAAFMLDADIDQCVSDLTTKTEYFVFLNEPRKAVVVNMLFNLGWGGYSKFRNMINALNDHDYETASAEMLDSRWARQVGGRAKELSRIMRSGEF